MIARPARSLLIAPRRGADCGPTPQDGRIEPARCPSRRSRTRMRPLALRCLRCSEVPWTKRPANPLTVEAVEATPPFLRFTTCFQSRRTTRTGEPARRRSVVASAQPADDNLLDRILGSSPSTGRAGVRMVTEALLNAFPSGRRASQAPQHVARPHRHADGRPAGGRRSHLEDLCGLERMRGAFATRGAAAAPPLTPCTESRGPPCTSAASRVRHRIARSRCAPSRWTLRHSRRRRSRRRNTPAARTSSMRDRSVR